MTTLTPDSPARPDAPTRRAAVVTAVVALVLAVLELGFAAWAWIATDEAARTSDDPLVGIGYLIALVIAVPGAAGALLAGLGWLLARRTAGLVLAIIAVVVAGAPIVLWLSFLTPSF
ncbi:hypothetical protein CFH99_18615 [Nocardioides aromaticivorans]|uniref:Uncharacterized protein n=1 Tax=Nocardioides aromaticivorans TaxID=200618 RepID=A0ABX7PP06_9ACTN|nr:hypothetical protein [Nocardioides aromaticivorans]QSR27641.1 hypothetical protein CFH99_18615 [Nocardioides aromaticivorans]